MRAPSDLGRLKKRSEFLAVAAASKKGVAAGVIVQAKAAQAAAPAGDPNEDSLPAAAPDQIRVGFTVTKKVGNAVVRNRARRRLRAAARELLPVHAEPGFDLVLIARNETPTRPFDKLRGDLLYALRKAGAAKGSDK